MEATASQWPDVRLAFGWVYRLAVVLRNPKRELDVPAPKNVGQLLANLDVVAESVLVIRNDTLATHDELLSEDDVVEIRPVMSGGSQ